MADIGTIMPERQALVRSLAEEQAMAVQKAGLDAEEFGKAVVEAVAANASIVLAERTSFANAIRKCLRDGLLPDNEEAALVVFRDKKEGVSKAKYVPMKIGLQRMFVRETGAEMSAGCVYTGDTIKVVKRVNGDDVLEIEQDPFATDRKFVGAWCYVKLPKRHGEAFTMNALEVAQVRATSAAQQYGPWKSWPDQMAQKSVIKRAINQLRYLIPKDGRLAAQLEEDDADGLVIDNPVESVLTTEKIQMENLTATRIPSPAPEPEDDDEGEDAPEAPATEDVEPPLSNDAIVEPGDIKLVF